MTDMGKCTTCKREGDHLTISCNLGLWSVSGKYSSELLNEALHYFTQYKMDGEYSEIIDGKSVMDTLFDRRPSV